MNHFLDRIKSAKVGEIVPVYKIIKGKLDAVELFAKLSNYGKKKYSLLLESADIVPKYGELSLGSASPSLVVRGKKESFEIKALNPLGTKLLQLIKKDLSFCQ